MVGVVISLSIGRIADSHPVDVKHIFSKTESNHSVISSNLLGRTAHAENVVIAGSYYASPPVKNPFQGFSSIIKGVEQSIVNTFSSNHYYLQNLFVRFSHTDLIFPFHYFW
jgi:hypothetical protein